MRRVHAALLAALLIGCFTPASNSRADESPVERNLQSMPQEEEAAPEQTAPEPESEPAKPAARRRRMRVVRNVPLPPERPLSREEQAAAPAFASPTADTRAATWSDLAPTQNGPAKATAELPTPQPDTPVATASLPANPPARAAQDPSASAADMPEGAAPSIAPEDEEDAHVGPGMEKQIESVSTECLKPELIALIKQTGAFFGKVPIITSGYRARGRRGSYHRRCMAADFFIPGVATQTLTQFLRALPGAGGVGTYCGTKLVHLDTGEPRNWGYCGLRRTYFAIR